jgi:hypothetical protein
VPFRGWQIAVGLVLCLTIVESLGGNVHVGYLKINSWDKIDASDERYDVKSFGVLPGVVCEGSVSDS